MKDQRNSFALVRETPIVTSLTQPRITTNYSFCGSRLSYSIAVLFGGAFVSDHKTKQRGSFAQ
jgi:hypothetical protein